MKFNIVKCSDIIDVRDGTHDSPKYVESGYPLVTSKNIKNNKINFENVNYISKEDFDKINKRSEVENGDILMPMIGTIGNPVLVNEETRFAIKNVALFKLARNEEINNRYFYYLLESEYISRQLEAKKRGGTQSFVSLTNIRELKIPVPERKIQDRIATVLDKSKEIIKYRKAQIEILDEIIQSVFYSMFGDPINNTKKFNTRTLGSIAKIVMGQSPKGEYYNTLGNGTPLINGPLEFGDKYPKERQWTTSPTKICEKDDILFCVRGATAGKMNFADKKYCIGRGIASIRSEKLVSTEYIYLTLKFMQNVFKDTSNGSTFMNISKDQLANIKVIITEKSMQDKFVEIVNKIEKEKELLKQSLEQLETNFKALEQKAFNGELFN